MKQFFLILLFVQMIWPNSAFCKQIDLNEQKIILWNVESIALIELQSSETTFIKTYSNLKIKNIISVNLKGHTLYILGVDDSEKFAIFSFDLKTELLEKIIYADGVINLSISPLYDILALVRYSPINMKENYRIDLYDITKRNYKTIVKDNVSRNSSLSWNPEKTDLAFQTNKKQIAIVDIEDGDINNLFEGEAPSFSSDGKHLAYRLNKIIFSYDLTNCKSSKIYTRFFWQTDFHNFLYWDQNDKYIISNVFTGLDGKYNKSLLIDTLTGNSVSFYSGEYFCGPFINKWE